MGDLEDTVSCAFPSTMPTSLGLEWALSPPQPTANSDLFVSLAFSSLCVCVCFLEVIVKWFPPSPSTMFFQAGSLWSSSSWIWLGWLATELQRSSLLSLLLLRLPMYATFPIRVQGFKHRSSWLRILRSGAWDFFPVLAFLFCLLP